MYSLILVDSGQNKKYDLIRFVGVLVFSNTFNFTLFV